MGINLGWIAVRSRLKEDLLERLGLEPIGDAVHEVGQAYAMADTPEGWTVVCFREPPSNMDETVAKSAPKGRTVCGFLSETVMASEIRGYQDGQFQWSIERDRSQSPGLIIKGEAPKALEAIQRRRDAEQAGPDAEDVDFLFEAPQDLGAALTGYRPGEGGLEWHVLGRQGHGASKGRPKAQKSLSAAIRRELVPLFLSLGWSAANEKPDLAWGDQIVRQIGEQYQTVWLNYASGHETYGTYITIQFFTRTPLTADTDWHVGGRTRVPPIPIFNRFPWGFARRKPEPPDPIQAAIDKAKIDIVAIDAFLKGGERAPCITTLTAREHPPKLLEPPQPSIWSKLFQLWTSESYRTQSKAVLSRRFLSGRMAAVLTKAVGAFRAQAGRQAGSAAKNERHPLSHRRQRRGGPRERPPPGGA